ncbi:MAG: SPFH domain-containing protein [Treponemataceae bacterium]
MNQEYISDEREAGKIGGIPVLILNIALMALALAGSIIGLTRVESPNFAVSDIVLASAAMLYLCLVGPALFNGLKILRPNEALVLTLFGAYYGTLRGPGFFFVNPFTSAANSNRSKPTSGATGEEAPIKGLPRAQNKKLSLKTMTLNNDKQKVNDALGTPIVVGIIVVWKVVNTAKAIFNVENYAEFLSIQSDAALRNIIRLYPYDADDAEGEKSLRGSSQEIAENLKAEIQRKVDVAGLEILEARITHLSYAPEIAAAMLQRQQASAIIAARQMIVEGAVGMVEMALAKLSDKKIVELDEERKAAMVSNLLVVLCGNKDAQPIVNSGSIY